LMLGHRQEGQVCGHVVVALFGLLQSFARFLILAAAAMGRAQSGPILRVLWRQPAGGFRRIMANSATNACRSP
jgi:hypothetical protein